MEAALKLCIQAHAPTAMAFVSQNSFLKRLSDALQTCSTARIASQGCRVLAWYYQASVPGAPSMQDRIQAALEAGLLKHAARLLGSPNVNVQECAVEAVHSAVSVASTEPFGMEGE